VYEELDAAWSRLVWLPGYRVALACHRFVAVVFAMLFAGAVVGIVMGLPGGMFLVFVGVAAFLAIVGALIAWIVLTLAVRFVSRQSAASGGTRFSPAWLPLLMGLYLRELTKPGRSRSDGRCPQSRYRDASGAHHRPG
jgi:hypothetical protein